MLEACADIKEKGSWLLAAALMGVLCACGEGRSVSGQSVTPVGNPPVAPDISMVVNGNDSVAITLKASDENDSDLSFAVFSNPRHGVLGPVTATGSASAELTYTSTEGYHGFDQFKFQVKNGAGGKALGSVSIVVNDGDPGYADRVALAKACNWPAGALTDEPWSSLLADPYDPAIAVRARAQYFDQKRDHTRTSQTYDALGDYLNYGLIVHHRESDTLRFDENGVPMLKYDGSFHYNPVTVAEYALSEYGRYLLGESSAAGLLAGADALAAVQDQRGALPYSFSWRHYLESRPYKPGWTSAMAQGLALSVYYRAYSVTGDPRYIEAGNAALSYLNTSVEEGGVRDTLDALDAQLDSHVIFEEYVTDPAVYTLNGFMFTMLGLYDWSATSGVSAELARELFFGSMQTLAAILPFYEIGGFSAYDLGHITHDVSSPHIGVSYHAVHIGLLHALGSITGDSCLAGVEEAWIRHVSSP